MYERFINILRKSEWYQPGETYLLACSGGMDSMVMLSLFIKAASEDKISLVAGHVNHQLRAAAGEDENFLKEFCDEHGVDIMTKCVDVNERLQHTGESMEMAARELRYDSLEKIRRSADASWICTAHTKSDQAETVLMRILSGSGANGLQGIRRINRRVVRPLLDFTRDTIWSFAQDQNIPFREDGSNHDLTIRRNWIRHVLIPEIREEYNPGVIDTLNRFSQIQTEYAEYLSERGNKAFSEVVTVQSPGEIILDIKPFQNYFTAIQKTVIFKCLSELGLTKQNLNFPQMDQLLRTINQGQPGSSFNLAEDLQVHIDRSQVLFSTQKIRWKFREPFQPDTTISLGKFLISIRLAADVTDELGKTSNEMTAYFDWESLAEDKLWWRTWEQGDMMTLPGGQSKKISDVWIDNKVPLWDKYRIPLLADGDEILWVPGIKRSGRGWITENTQKILKLIAKQNHEY